MEDELKIFTTVAENTEHWNAFSLLEHMHKYNETLH